MRRIAAVVTSRISPAASSCFPSPLAAYAESVYDIDIDSEQRLLYRDLLRKSSQAEPTQSSTPSEELTPPPRPQQLSSTVDTSSSRPLSDESSTFVWRNGGLAEEAANSVVYDTARSMALGALGVIINVYMRGFNSFTMWGADKLENAVRERDHAVPLLTVSNHVSAGDDPLMLAPLLPLHLWFDGQSVKWTFCASNRCFTSPALSRMFSFLKILPLYRNVGLEESGLGAGLERLQRGDWIHIFPEGTRNTTSEKSLHRCRPGVGFLIAESPECPIVIPMVHSGMEGILPKGASGLKTGNEVFVLVGDPLDFRDRLAYHRENGTPKVVIYQDIAARVGVELVRLKQELRMKIMAMK